MFVPEGPLIISYLKYRDYLATRFTRPCRTTKADGSVFRQPSRLKKSPSLSLPG